MPVYRLDPGVSAMLHRFRLSLFILSLLAPWACLRATPLPQLHWRLLGPFRGGWATVAAGIPTQPEVYLIGTAGGGVWRTENAGRTWTPLTDHIGASSIGALAIAPSDPRVIYAGSGQVTPRYDIAAGDGVYRSADGGRTWRNVGLADTRHIGGIWVDPANPDDVVVAALGRVFGPNRERGLYRSTNGGTTWQQVLFVDDSTGGVELAADPKDPHTLYAALWTLRNYPWLSYFEPMVGPGSAIYVSHDAGLHWQKLGGQGWPTAPLGRIGLAVTDTAQGPRLYASIDGGDDAAVTGLWRSDDGGARWQRVFAHAPVANWYASRMTVDPRDPDTIFTTGQSIRVSHDAGKTFQIAKGAPGGDDYHFLWINPLHPECRITASDQGAVVSMDGGRTWSSWYNQPTGQFYHLATDQRFPYWIYSGQQDSGTVGIASRSDYGSITFRDWHPVGGDERDYDLPDPADPDIVYGTGLGGRVSRWDARTGQVENISPWPVSSYGARPTATKYRHTWIAPMAVGPQAPYPLYVASQVLSRSTDQGRHWSVISPDLTGAVPGTQECDHPGSLAHAKACGYGVIYSIGLAPSDPQTLWIGTDDGLVQVTHDGGQHWKDVTPKGVPSWARIDSVDVSATDPRVAYLAVDNHRNGDDSPYAFRTTDGGQTWQAIVHGLPQGHFVAVLRADPVKAGLLYAGTDAGVYVSLDDGGAWQPLQLNLPTAWVRDLAVHGDDLIAATQGRAIWVLDDVTPLRQLAPSLIQQPLHLFAPATAVRVHANNNKDTPLPPETPVGQNPPQGVALDYWLGPATNGPVRLTIRDSAGTVVRRFDSGEAPAVTPANRYFAQGWLKPAAPLPGTPGMHRFIWDLRETRPKAITYHYSIAAVWGEDTPALPKGPFVLPGRYTVELSAAGHTARASLTIVEDPRVPVTSDQLARLLAFQQAVGTAMARSYAGAGQVQAIAHALESQQRTFTGHAGLQRAAAGLVKALNPSQGEPLGRRFARANGELTGLAMDAGAADRPPTAAQEAVLTEAQQAITSAEAAWQALQQGPLAALNAQLQAAGFPPLRVPATDTVVAKPGPEGADLP